MKYDPQGYRLVHRELETLAHELLELQDVVHELRAVRGVGWGLDRDPSWVFEQVTAAADALVEAIRLWVPSLVPTPRALDEVLRAIASWLPDPHTLKAAKNAQLLFEQLQAESYGVSTLNPDEVPDLDEFIADLRDTVGTVEHALS